MHSDCEAAKCLLTLLIARFIFSSSCRMIAFNNTILQLGICFERFDFSMGNSFTILLDILVVVWNYNTNRTIKKSLSYMRDSACRWFIKCLLRLLIKKDKVSYKVLLFQPL